MKTMVDAIIEFLSNDKYKLYAIYKVDRRFKDNYNPKKALSAFKSLEKANEQCAYLTGLNNNKYKFMVVESNYWNLIL